MTAALSNLSWSERLNFLVTNRLPRRWLTQLVGWFSQIDNPLLARISIRVWQFFVDDLRLDESPEQHYRSLRDCFIRPLKPGMRPVAADPAVVTSPCDAIVGAHGRVQNGEVFQAKGFPYALADLIPDPAVQARYQDGVFVTLRLKSSMYHRFHAPTDCRVRRIDYISGDTWNVNPIALKVVERLFCRNERAVVSLELPDPEESITLVPVAAILVASMRFHALGENLDIRAQGNNRFTCDAEYKKGDEMGYFQHGSTIIAFANRRFSLHPTLQEGQRINLGQPLLIRSPEVEPATYPSSVERE